MSETPEMPHIDEEVKSDEIANEADSSKRTIRYLIIFGLIIVIFILGFIVYLNVSQGARGSVANDQNPLDPAEAARGSASLVDAYDISGSVAEPHAANDLLNSLPEDESLNLSLFEARFDQLTDLFERMDNNLNDIKSNQADLANSLVSHEKKLESIISRQDDFDNIVRSHIRTSNQIRESIRDLNDHVSQIDGSISNEFARFPIFVWGPSSWGGRRFLTVSHMDSPRHTTDLVEGDTFHGWVLESAGAQTAVFRSGDRLYEVDL